MKLIIDIPKELKQKIDEGFTNQVIINKLWDATKNGIPLEQIRQEILDFKEKCNASDYLGCGILELIDKYK